MKTISNRYRFTLGVALCVALLTQSALAEPVASMAPSLLPLPQVYVPQSSDVGPPYAGISPGSLDRLPQPYPPSANSLYKNARAVTQPPVPTQVDSWTINPWIRNIRQGSAMTERDELEQMEGETIEAVEPDSEQSELGQFQLAGYPCGNDTCATCPPAVVGVGMAGSTD